MELNLIQNFTSDCNLFILLSNHILRLNGFSIHFTGLLLLLFVLKPFSLIIQLFEKCMTFYYNLPFHFQRITRKKSDDKDKKIYCNTFLVSFGCKFHNNSLFIPYSTESSVLSFFVSSSSCNKCT